MRTKTAILSIANLKNEDLPTLRQAFQVLAGVEKIDFSLERSVAVLHYSPTIETLEGEPAAIYQYLGSQRLADAIDRFDHVKAVVHGHAHHGKYEGKTPRGTPVFNVAQFVVRQKFGRPYALLEI